MLTVRVQERACPIKALSMAIVLLALFALCPCPGNRLAWISSADAHDCRGINCKPHASPGGDCKVAPQCEGADCPEAIPCLPSGPLPIPRGAGGPSPKKAAPAKPITRLTGLWSGVQRALSSYEIIIPIGAFALAAGRLGSLMAIAGLASLFTAFLAGPLVMRAGWTPALWQLAPVALILSGLLLAGLDRVNRYGIVPLALVIGTACGALRELLTGPSQFRDLPFDVASAATPILFAILAAAFSISLRARWLTIAQRIAGSWLIAAGIMLIALALRPDQTVNL